jgi:outer membrane receptor protein involved in Fe transport
MTTERKPLISLAVRAALYGTGILALSAAQSTLAQAQAAPAGAAASKDMALEEVVVTGSRIAAANLSSISPVTMVTAEEIKSSGVTRIEDVVNSLPSVTSDQGSGLSMGSNGTATVNLRGLGAQRTLVLVNGRRMMGGDPGAPNQSNPGSFASAADLNTIPVALIKRVDVLTGGASSVYGADAVAGVVNFVMVDDFEGVRVDANIGSYSHSNHQSYLKPLIEGQNPAQTYPSGSNWDGTNKDLTIMLGGNFADGRGNITGYVGYRVSSPITADHRDFAQCVLTNAGDGSFFCRGSSNSAPTMIVGYNDGGFHQVDANGDIVDRYARYNYSQTHYLQRQDERYTAGMFGKMKFNDHAEAYTEFMFMDDNTRGNYAPAGAFFGSGQQVDPVSGISNGTLGVNCGDLAAGYGNATMNPYLTQNAYNQICNFAPYNFDPVNGVPGLGLNLLPNGIAQVNLARRNIEGGPRQENFTHTSFRGVFGVRGDINDAWKYDAVGSWSLVRMTDWHNNDTSTSRIQNSLLAIRDANGNIVCQGGQTGCVPWNIFDPTQGPPSAASIAYLSAPGLFQGVSEEDVVTAYISGDLGKSGVKLPSAKDGLQVVLGAEYRRDTLTTHPDAELESGDLAGNGSPTPPVSGYNHVFEGFTELRLPIAADMPWAKTLDAEVGYRYSEYQIGFSTNTYKFGLQWAPVSDVRLRASYNRAARVPNLQELYNPPHVGLDGGNDPCAAGTATATQCTWGNPGTTIYPAFDSPAGQFNGIVGGSTKLQPEVGTTTEVGLVITPSALPNFSMTIDYSDIKITNLIQNYGSNLILNSCYNGPGPTNSWCALIHRDPAGTIWASPQGYVIDPLLNEGSETNKSIDLGLAYRFHLGKAGDLRMRLDGTYLQELKFAPQFGKAYDCAGDFGPSCAPAAPHWRHLMSFDWDTPKEGLAAGLTWRYYGSTTNSNLDPASPDFTGADASVWADPHLPSVSYIDLHASYQVDKITFRLGINNALDKDPPLIDCNASGGNSIYCESNTYSSMYSVLGRNLFLNVTADF